MTEENLENKIKTGLKVGCALWTILTSSLAIFVGTTKSISDIVVGAVEMASPGAMIPKYAEPMREFVTDYIGNLPIDEAGFGYTMEGLIGLPLSVGVVYGGFKAFAKMIKD